MRAIAAVLFDLDDTLMDAESAWRDGVRHLIARRQAGGVDHARALDAWGEVFPEWFEGYLRGHITLAESRAGRIRDWSALLGLDVPADEELAWFDTYVEGYRRGWALFPDAAPALKALAGLPLGLVTNGDSTQQRDKVSVLALDTAFDVVLVSSEVGVPKPEPAIFLAAAQRLGVAPEACLMVGDRLDRDVAGALAAGMQAAWLQRPDGPESGTVPPDDLVGRFTTITTLHAVPEMVGIAAHALRPGVRR
jgi:putative hydrolase of the HAD superfamily